MKTDKIFIAKMLELGAQLDRSCSGVEQIMIVNDAEILYHEHMVEVKKLFNAENPSIEEKSVLDKIEDETIDFSPVKSVTIILSNQCKVPSNSVKSLVFTTRCGKNEVFSIPLEHILNTESSALEINPNQKYPAMKFTITSWIFQQIKHHLVKMEPFNYQLMPNND